MDLKQIEAIINNNSTRFISECTKNKVHTPIVGAYQKDGILYIRTQLIKGRYKNQDITLTETQLTELIQMAERAEKHGRDNRYLNDAKLKLKKFQRSLWEDQIANH